MVKKFFASFVFVFGLTLVVYGQSDPILFSVNNKPVHLSEFNYIYSKTNGDKADYSRASLEEYLELYQNFKLKVERAREMQLDTIPSLQRELAGYRRQLANSYLVDKEVTERLVQEAYERSLKDVNISHIMVTVKPNASEKEIAIAEQKLMNVKKKLDAGQSFEELAKEFSEDKNTKDNGGALGYFTALFPDGFYALESAAYETKVGQVSDIVRTALGFHLVKVNEIRDARGQMEVAHILIRKDPKDPNSSAAAKAKIDSLNQAIKAGTAFEDVAKQNSEDKRTAQKGGYIGFIGIRQVSKDFEDAAFALENDGDLTMPVESSIGWHIIKRVSKKPVESADIAKRRIQTKMQENKKKSKNPKYNRLNTAEQSMINRIKKEGNFTENKGIIKSFVASLDSTFVTYKWKASKDKPSDVVFTLGTDYKTTLAEFEDFCQRNSKRMRMGTRMERGALVDLIYDEFVRENCLKYEESQLDVKYPEFKSLMREYEEGILLFEATKILVWDKASQDSVGLVDFHSTRKANYTWNQRAVTSKYTVKAGNEEEVEKIRKDARKKPADTVLEKYNKEEPIVTADEEIFEKGKSRMPRGLEWRAGAVSDVTVNQRSKASIFHKIEEILPPSEKTLKEARGYVIADYQDYLDKKWLEELRSTYKIETDQAVFEGLIKE